jgi:hypothetical protein
MPSRHAAALGSPSLSLTEKKFRVRTRTHQGSPQTPTALVEVDSAADAKEVFKGKAVVDWRGQLFRQSD